MHGKNEQVLLHCMAPALLLNVPRVASLANVVSDVSADDTVSERSKTAVAEFKRARAAAARAVQEREASAPMDAGEHRVEAAALQAATGHGSSRAPHRFKVVVVKTEFAQNFSSAPSITPKAKSTRPAMSSRESKPPSDAPSTTRAPIRECREVSVANP